MLLETLQREKNGHWGWAEGKEEEKGRRKEKRQKEGENKRKKWNEILSYIHSQVCVPNFQLLIQKRLQIKCLEEPDAYNIFTVV